MRVIESWLREWVNPTLNTEALAEQLTLAGLEVDQIIPVAGSFTGVVVAHVLKTAQHPDADRLTVCEVDAGGDRILQVVCGAKNVRAGLKVALAQIGACLPGDFKIKASKLRGQLSEGMLCSASELGLEDTAEGIIELPEDAPIGVNIRDYLQLDDQIFDIDLTPNRADCLSILGMAREVAALNQIPMLHTSDNPISPVFDGQCTAEIYDKVACSRYLLREIKDINPHAITPLWMKERLRRSGFSSIHPVVDAVNYVMIELGQPMHAFDAQKIQGSLQVRAARPNEQLTLLNQNEVSLDETVLVIADDVNAVAMAGVMGGLDSAVNTNSTHIILESAFFNPLKIAGVARRFGLSSESAQRFERGVDPSLSLRALERVTDLIINIAGGQASTILEWGDHPQNEKKIILFSSSKVKQLTGLSISDEIIASILTHLGLQVNTASTPWQVEIPSYRFDLTLEVDLVEEILRVHGYHQLETTDQPLSVMRQGTISPIARCLDDCIQFFSMRGYSETISYSFVDPEIQHPLYGSEDALVLMNPLSSELSEMRRGLWPGLIAALVRNVNRQQTTLRCFETGVVFQNQGKSEKLQIGGLLYGDVGHLNWSEVTRRYDFFDLKGDLQGLFAHLKCSDRIQFVPAEHPALHPGKSAQLLYDEKPFGWIGCLHPSWLDELALTSDVVVFEMELSMLVDQPPVQYQRISKYPSIRRDLALLLPSDLPVSAAEELIKRVVPKGKLKALDIFDEYRGAHLPEGKKSVALSILLQDDERTLTDDEINQIISAILKSLEGLNILLRE